MESRVLGWDVNEAGLSRVVDVSFLEVFWLLIKFCWLMDFENR